MSRNTDRPETPHANNLDRTPRRGRRRNAPALTTLEDRKLLTGGYGMPTVPMMMQQAPAQVFQAHTRAPQAGAQVQANPSLSFEGDTVAANDRGGWGSTTRTDASGQDWISLGANAQFGPLGSLIFSGGAGANAAWSKADLPIPGKPGVPSTATDATSTDAAATATDTTTTDATSTDAAAADATTTDATTSREELDAAFEKYHADLQAIQDKSEVTPKLLATLREAQDAIKTAATGDPDEALVTTLQDDQKSVLESGTFTDEQQATLKADYTAVLQSAGVSDETIASFFAAQDAVKAASNVTSDDLATLSADREAIQSLIDAQGDAFTGQAPGGFSGGMQQGGFGGGMQQGGFSGGFQQGGMSQQGGGMQQGGFGGGTQQGGFSGGFGGGMQGGGFSGGFQQGGMSQQGGGFQQGGFGGGMRGGFGSELPGFSADYTIPGGSSRAVAPSGVVGQSDGSAIAATATGDVGGSQQVAPNGGPQGGVVASQAQAGASSRVGGPQGGGFGGALSGRMASRSQGGFGGSTRNPGA